MATTQHDYYELLGVARDASDEDIKRAFRKLARELHPDVNDAPDAEERFRQVAEAYEVLSKPESRQLYDRFGHAGLRSGGFQPGHFDFGSLTDIFSAFFGDDLFSTTGRPTRSRGADLVAEVEVELVEAARGATREVSYGVAVTCAHCSGDGAEPGTPVRTCETCGGAGRVQQVARSLLGEFVRSTACPTCGGAGRIVETACRTCSGAGRVAEERTLRVDVPAGIHDGQRIRLAGEGHVGDGGGRAGDVYVQVRVRPDPRFVREGNDVFSTVDLTITQAALGASVTVSTLEGEVQLDFDPGTQAGTVRVLRGKGMPVLQGFGRGDQRVLVNVVVPRRLTDEQREALEQFDRLTDGDTYRDDGGEGFFDKLKSAFR